MDELSPNVHEFQDPYAVFLEADRESIAFNGFVSMFSWELPFSSSLLLFISELCREFKQQMKYLLGCIGCFISLDQVMNETVRVGFDE